MNIRPEIMAFAEEMEYIMSIYDDQKGDSYKTCDLSYLAIKLSEKYADVQKSILGVKLDHITPMAETELVKCAMRCMMLWFRGDD